MDALRALPIERSISAPRSRAARFEADDEEEEGSEDDEADEEEEVGRSKVTRDFADDDNAGEGEGPRLGQRHTNKDEEEGEGRGARVNE